ncbi:SDR family NAD(P)-dependent oxidoreductase [Azospirillum sp. A1-3]|uniref:SDR family NAD(P)-dependent oxidoreductase n=1 Tax=Azospirillum sp. A1-3 TaxID=185874 RepID=UPI0020776938|nr:SDR family NAD(P)-dependent oxidoreductase [Azospirillum sp. A1-3]MCM8735362.1 SDR family NAD(P)-dependent oxidoreductase [Azospirillum sp. A1-3]
MKIRDQAAIVTGGASGMGAQTARALAGAGAMVAILDRDPGAASRLAAEIGGFAVVCDVASEDSVSQALATARERHGPARICVNCAGIAPGKRIVGRNGPMPSADFQRAVMVNLVGTFHVLAHAAHDMTALEPDPETAERGVVINTASIAAFEGQIGQSAYAASKGGIVGLTLPAARELASSAIRVVTIAPGLMATPMMDALPVEVREGMGAQVPFPNRLGQPDEFASLVLHVVGNPLLNGTVIRLDGALRMPPR